MYKFKIFLSILLILSLPVSTQAAQTAPTMQVNAKAAVLMEPTSGTVLLEQNAHEKLPPASVTKVMTMLLIYEAVAHGKIKWDDVVTVSEHAASMGGSQVFLEPTEKQTVRDLTKCVVVASANDAAVALAEFIAGSEEGFVLMMNQKAKDLGMLDTHFINACGLDTPGHYTSAYDIALMSRELTTKYPEVFDFTKIWMDDITHKTARGESLFGLSNTNKLIRQYDAATGLKTGSTSQAQFCISATASRDGMNQIAVILGSPDSNTRFQEAIRMFDYGFANYGVVKGDEAGTVMGKIKVFKGKEEEADVCVKTQISCLIPKGKTAAMESKTELLDAISAPVEKGSKAGEIVYYYLDKEVGRSDLIVVNDIAKATLTDVLQKVTTQWFTY